MICLRGTDSTLFVSTKTCCYLLNEGMIQCAFMNSKFQLNFLWSPLTCETSTIWSLCSKITTAKCGLANTEWLTQYHNTYLAWVEITLLNPDSVMSCSSHSRYVGRSFLSLCDTVCDSFCDFSSGHTQAPSCDLSSSPHYLSSGVERLKQSRLGLTVDLCKLVNKVMVIEWWKLRTEESST